MSCQVIQVLKGQFPPKSKQHKKLEVEKKKIAQEIDDRWSNNS